MPKPERSVAGVMTDREPNGRFAPGNQAALGHGPNQRPSRKFLRSMLLEALAGEQLRQLPVEQKNGAGRSRAALAEKKTGKRAKKGEAPPKTGKTIQLVRAAAINDIILGLQHLFRAAKTHPKYFLASLELIHEVLDSDDKAAAGTRQTLFLLAGNYRDERQVHVHQGEGPEPAPGPPPVHPEPLRNGAGEIVTPVEPIE